jgi:LPXTG-motif cell wall-anchored protein
MLPSHGETGNQDAPIGTGIAVLAALGGAYLVAKKRREE